MGTQMETGFAPPTSFPQFAYTIRVIWNRGSKRLRDGWQAARQERVVARLAPHLRYDIGEIDCRPPAPRPLAETLKAYQQSPEGLRRL